MNKRIKWLKHKGNKILFLDFSSANTEESTQLWFDAEEYIVDYQGELPLLLLIDVSNVEYDTNTKETYKDVRDMSRAVSQRWAVVGANEKTKAMIKSICIFIEDEIIFTDDIEEAKKSLTSNGGEN